MLRPRTVATVVVAMLLAACRPTPDAPSGSTTPSIDAVGTACAPIDLRWPDGTPVDLSGEWISDPLWFPYSAGERTSILQVRDCVWISITDAAYREEPQSGAGILAQFNGRLSEDFSLEGLLVTVVHPDVPFFSYQPSGKLFTLRFKLEYEEGTLTMQELRQANDPRCLTQVGEAVPLCPDPTVLHQVRSEASPEATPSP